MLPPRCVQCIDSHTAGEPTRIVLEGLPPVPGASMADKAAWLARELDALRTALLHEPRGHRDMFGAVLLPPCRPEADLGVVFMDGGGYLPMCGHGAMGVATVAVECGRVEVREPWTVVVLDAPAGLVRCRVRVAAGRAEEVVLENVPSFLAQRDLEVEVPGAGRFRVDLAFGGSFFALLDAAAHGLDLSPTRHPQLIELGLGLREALNRRHLISHPELTRISGVELVEYWEKGQGGVDFQHLVVFADGQVDRSPCGTGTSAHLAALYARGELALLAETRHAGPLGTTFTARAVAETRVGDYPAIRPEITGRAWTIGRAHFVISPEDPLAHGFRLGR